MAIAATTRRRLDRLGDVRRWHGAWELPKVLLDRLVCQPVHLKLVNLFWLDIVNLRLPPPNDSRFTFRFLTADEVRHFATDPSNGLDDEFVAERLASGRDLCFGVLAQGRLAAYSWCTLESIEARHAAGVALSYPKDAAYSYNGFAHPDFRGARLFGATIGLALQQLAGRGVTKFLGIVDWTNPASRNSLNRLGFVPLGLMLVIQLGARQIVLAPRRAKRLGLRFGAASAGFAP